jgi:hypothetical protein
MFRLLLVVALFAVSFTPVDAREPPRKGERIEKRSDLRRDIDRISKEIYPPRQQGGRRR